MLDLIHDDISFQNDKVHPLYSIKYHDTGRTKSTLYLVYNKLLHIF